MNSSLDTGIPLLTEIVISPRVVPVDESARDAASAAVVPAVAMPIRSTGYAIPRVPVTSAAPATLTRSEKSERSEIPEIPKLPFPTPTPPSTSTAPELRVDSPAPASSLSLPADAASDAALLFESRYAASAQDWEQLEINISERISRQVLSRIDVVLEQRVRDSLADVLQLSVEGLAMDIKRGLHQTLEDVISLAVAQEIARLQTSKD